MTTIQTLLIWVIPVLFAITVHEFSHGFIASKLGDKTALMMGRLTLNPIKHIDPVGTILVPTLLYLTAGFVFGWAKPVPINFDALRSPKRDMVLVAMAGPASNFIMAGLWLAALIYSISINSFLLLEMSKVGIQINLILAVLNLIPLPPLDGSRIVAPFLPTRLAYKYNRLEDYGIFIILGLIFLGIFESVIIPIVRVIQELMFSASGLI